MTPLSVLQYIPAIIQVIKAVEAAIPGQGRGELKLAALREMLEAIDGGFGQAWPTVQKIVGILVTLLNKTNWAAA